MSYNQDLEKQLIEAKRYDRINRLSEKGQSFSTREDTSEETSILYHVMLAQLGRTFNLPTPPFNSRLIEILQGTYPLQEIISDQAQAISREFDKVGFP